MSKRHFGRVLMGGMGGLLLASAGAVHADTSLTLAFAPDRTLETGTPGVYGCYNDPGEARGSLASTANEGPCHSGKLGVAAEGEIPSPAEFTSPPFGHTLELTGPTSIVTHHSNLDASGTSFERSTLEYQLHEILSSGEAVLIASGTAIEDFQSWGRRDGAFNVGAYAVAAGSRLRLRLGVSTSPTSRGDLLFGGTNSNGYDYGDAGITFTVRDAGPGSGSGLPAVGALPSALLAPLLLGALIRRHARVLRGAVLVLVCAGPVAAQAELTLLFHPDRQAEGALSPEGCFQEPGFVRGTMSPFAANGVCHSGRLGTSLAYFSGDPDDPYYSDTADFSSAPFADGLSLEGTATIAVHYPAQDGASLGYRLYEVQADGGVNWIGGQETAIEHMGAAGPGQPPSVGVMDFGAYELAPGSHLRLRLYSLDAEAGGRLLFGGDSNQVVVSGGSYDDARITFALPDTAGPPPEPDPVPTPDPESPATAPGQPDGTAASAAGSLPGALLIPFLLIAVARLRWHSEPLWRS